MQLKLINRAFECISTRLFNNTYSHVSSLAVSLDCPCDDVIKWKYFSALLALCAGTSPVTSEFPSQRPVKRSLDGFVNLHLN